MSEENVEVARAAYAAFNRGDMAAWRDLVDPAVEFVDHNPPPDESGAFQGRDAVERYLTTWQMAFDAFRVDIDEYIFAKEWVVCTGTWRGTGKGSAVDVEFRGADLLQVRGGTVIRIESGFASKEAALESRRAERVGAGGQRMGNTPPMTSRNSASKPQARNRSIRSENPDQPQAAATPQPDS